MTSTRRPLATIAATVLFGFALAEVITAIVASTLSGLSLHQLDGLLVPTNTTIGLSLALAGWPIAAYRPGNRVGWLLLGGGCSYAFDRCRHPVAGLRRRRRLGQSAVESSGHNH